MGTRHLIGVRLNNEWKVAQYGQWDGYPSGQGSDVLKFLHESNLPIFREQVTKCFFLTTEELDAAYRPYSTDGYMTGAQSDAFAASPYGHLSRDTGAKILGVIYNAINPVALQDNSEFLNDGLYCEWAYVIDLDRNMLQVYQGYKRSPETDPVSVTYKSEGFISPHNLPGGDAPYYVHLVKEFPLENLPKEDDFIKILEPDEEEAGV
jgi:hypothetical protein